MNRVFTFGCSFTSWVWPTWADFLIQDFKNRDLFGCNFGKCGAGNQYIFIKLIEANRHFKFNENDLVVVCWTSFHREDRFSGNRWVTPGNIYSQNIYKEEFINEWADPIHYALRDCSIMYSAKKVMENIGCKFVSFSMNDLMFLDSSNPKSLLPEIYNTIKFYGDTIKTDLPAMMDYLNLVLRDKKTVESRPLTYWGHDKVKNIQPEWHPTPEEHFKYMSTNILPFIDMSLSPKTEKFIEFWVDKIKTIEQPINLNKTGWSMNQNDFMFFDLHAPIKKII